MEVRINTHGNPVPTNHEGKGDWFDLSVCEDIELKKGEYKQISLGISVETPVGYTTYVVPRSSTFKHYGIILVNSVGVIDSSYCGDEDVISFLALATRDCVIKKGERIAQMMTFPTPDIKYVETSFLGNANRGGIGSTGK